METLTTPEWVVLGIMMVFMLVMSIVEEKDIRRK